MTRHRVGAPSKHLERSVERVLLVSGRDQLSAVELMAPGLDRGRMPSPGS